jgi:DNA-binding response OmpR family regulator
MLTAKSQEIDKVLGLELGADDYVTKPFSRRELLARVKAILRRRATSSESVDAYSFGEIEVDFDKYQARKAGRAVHLTRLEYDLLRFLIEHKEGVVRRDEILEKVWEDAASVYPRTVDTHVGRLRKKLEDDPENPRYIVSVRGVGYRFAD